MVQRTPEFTRALKRLQTGLENVAAEAMADVMTQAQKDALRQYRWRRKGTYTAVDRGENTWDWEVSGIAADSIFGYVQGRAKKAPSGKQEVYRTVTSDSGESNTWVQVSRMLAFQDGPRTPGRVVGILTMLAAHAPYIQDKEENGSVWGTPAAGAPITVETLSVNWRKYYVPKILRPRFAALLTELLKGA